MLHNVIANMNRYKAFATHLTISIIIVGIFFAIMRLVWYPGFYFDLLSAWDVLYILGSVDIVLGPVLTLIVFVPKKKGLKFDLSAIAAMQIGALFFGGSIVYGAKPVYVAYAADMFKIASHRDIDKSKLRYPEMQKAPAGGPMLVFAKVPEDPQTRNDLSWDILSGGPDIEKRTELYEPLSSNLAHVAKKALDIDWYYDRAPGNRAKIEAFFARHGGNKQRYLFNYLVGYNKDIMLVLDRASGQFVDIIEIDPWIPKSERQRKTE